MNINLKQLENWFLQSPGRSLLQTEIAELNKILPSILGQYLLQIAGPNDPKIFAESPIKYRLRISPNFTTTFSGLSIQANLADLPLQAESIDLVLLLHVLEFIKNPEKLLAEIFQALTAEGQIIICCFNSWSLWGLKQKCQSIKALPWIGKFSSMWRLKKILQKNGFEIVSSESLYFRPALENPVLLQQLNFLEVMGRFSWSAFGAVNLIQARKRVVKLNVIEVAWPKEKTLSVKSSYLEPSTRSKINECKKNS